MTGPVILWDEAQLIYKYTGRWPENAAGVETAGLALRESLERLEQKLRADAARDRHLSMYGGSRAPEDRIGLTASYMVVDEPDLHGDTIEPEAMQRAVEEDGKR